MLPSSDLFTVDSLSQSVRETGLSEDLLIEICDNYDMVIKYLLSAYKELFSVYRYGDIKRSFETEFFSLFKIVTPFSIDIYFLTSQFKFCPPRVKVL